MRKFVISPKLRGFWSGVARGMSASVEVFDEPRQVTRYHALGGMAYDCEAIASDVERAKTRFTRTNEEQRRRAAS